MLGDNACHDIVKACFWEGTVREVEEQGDDEAEGECEHYLGVGAADIVEAA